MILDEINVRFFFFNDTATTEIYTLSLHDALPISGHRPSSRAVGRGSSLSPPRSGRRPPDAGGGGRPSAPADRKSTRLNSSHANISYAVFCLKKKNIPNRLALKLKLLNSIHSHIYY